jgi:acetyltransferase-like isoleucine patch superfamily enzyme
VNNDDYLAEPPVVKNFANIGAGCVILPGVTIGINAIIGAGSVVTRSVPDGGKVYGQKAELREVSFKHLQREYGWVGGV